MNRVLVYFLIAFLVFSSLRAEPVKLELWHAMEGFIAGKLQELVDKFNTSQKEYEVQLVRKGNYTETFKEGVRATKSKKNPPHILQVYEVATPTFMQEKNLYIPVHALLHKYRHPVPQEALVPAIVDFYSNEKKQLLGLPFNIATGLLFYNKEIFQKAGLDPDAPPKTWEELEFYAKKLNDAGCSCVFTTAWPSGYLLEHFSARHNLPFATKKNGFARRGARLRVNSKDHVFNLNKLTEWEKNGIFRYAGRFVEEPEQLFTSGRCAMIMQSNSRMAILRKAASFPVGGGALPYWRKLTPVPHNLVTGGAALWAIRGHSEKEEKGMAAFFTFLVKPKTQQYWVEATGYLPISKSAYEELKAAGYYKKNPHNEIAIQSLMLPSTPYSKGIRLPGFVEVRETLIDALEGAFEGKHTPKEELDAAVIKGNKLIRQAEK